MFSRTILSAAFLNFGEPLLLAPLHKLSGNPSAISLDAPKPRSDSSATVYLFGLAGRTSTRLIKVLSGILQKHSYYFGNVFGLNFPI